MKPLLVFSFKGKFICVFHFFSSLERTHGSLILLLSGTGKRGGVGWLASLNNVMPIQVQFFPM
jgi:hypothetical protein